MYNHNTVPFPVWQSTHLELTLLETMKLLIPWSGQDINQSLNRLLRSESTALWGNRGRLLRPACPLPAQMHSEPLRK